MFESIFDLNNGGIIPENMLSIDFHRSKYTRMLEASEKRNNQQRGWGSSALVSESKRSSKNNVMHIISFFAHNKLLRFYISLHLTNSIFKHLT